jgi:tellurite resistance protein TerC
MGVETWVWVLTLVVLVGVLLIDLFVIGRRPHEPSLTESTLWVTLYVGLAIAFGLGIWMVSGSTYAGQFYAGGLTEYSLSVDNLFVFVIIMTRFAVPRQFQQKALLIGIVLALVMRGIFIAAGAALISQFVWVFYIFGAFLLITAVRLVGHGTDDASDFKENALIRFARRALRTSKEYDAKAHFFTTQPDGRRMFSPLIIVMVAIGTTDLVFALDSIPAIFGLTKEPYIVFTANVFALMGLRQLYFLLGGLLDRLKYLSYGLALVLAFIGVKLVMEALHANNVPFINGGDPFEVVPEISIATSLAVIGTTLAVTTVASLISSHRDRQREASTGAAS